MIPRPVAITSVLVLGLWNVLAVPTVLAQEPTDRQEAPRRTTERSVVEGLSTSGDTTVLSEVVDETVRRDAETSQRTRREFVTDVNGRQRLVSTIEERHVVRPDGGHQIIRDFTEPDLNYGPAPRAANTRSWLRKGTDLSSPRSRSPNRPSTVAGSSRPSESSSENVELPINW